MQMFLWLCMHPWFTNCFYYFGNPSSRSKLSSVYFYRYIFTLFSFCCYGRVLDTPWTFCDSTPGVQFMIHEIHAGLIVCVECLNDAAHKHAPQRIALEIRLNGAAVHKCSLKSLVLLHLSYTSFFLM